MQTARLCLPVIGFAFIVIVKPFCTANIPFAYSMGNFNQRLLHDIFVYILWGEQLFFQIKYFTIWSAFINLNTVNWDLCRCIYCKRLSFKNIFWWTWHLVYSFTIQNISTSKIMINMLHRVDNADKIWRGSW